MPSRIRITCRSQQTANRRCRLQQCSHAQYRPGCTRNARDDFFFTGISSGRLKKTFEIGKDCFGWDQCQARTWDAIGRHTALTALAQLRDTAIRNALCGDITLPPAPPGGSGGHDDAPGDRNGQDDRRRDDGARPVTLTWASRSATRRSPPGPGSPARPAPAPSGSPSPRPPA